MEEQYLPEMKRAGDDFVIRFYLLSPFPYSGAPGGFGLRGRRAFYGIATENFLFLHRIFTDAMV